MATSPPTANPNPTLVTNRANRYFPADLVWRALGLDLPGGPMPLTAPCPLCPDGRMLVVADPSQGGAWHSCASCGFAGGAIELAARRMGLGPLDAARELIDAGGCSLPRKAGAPGFLESALEPALAARQRIQEFWMTAQCTLPDFGDPTAARLLSRYGVREAAVRGPAWGRRGGRLIGFATRAQLEAVLMPGSLAYRNATRRAHATGTRDPLFHGLGWEWLIVVPFWDLPGRIGGMLMLGRDGDPVHDVAFRKFPAPHGRRHGQPRGPEGDPGLGLVAGAAPAPAEMGLEDAVFLDYDVERALRMQMRHLRDHDDPLPLALAWNNQTYRTGPGVQGWPPRRWVVRDGRGDDPLVLASLLDGELVRTSPELVVAETDPTVPPATVLRAALRSVESWDRVLERRFAAADPAEITSLLRELGWGTEVLSAFVAQTTTAVADRVRGATTRHAPSRSVVLDQKRVRECNGRWARITGGHCDVVLDGILRIDAIVRYAGSDRVEIQGRLIRDGREAPFQAPLAAFQADPLDWLRNWSLQHGMGVLGGMPRWSRRLVDLALKFQPARDVVGLDRGGWDAGRRGFVFAAYVQDGDGSVSPPDGVRLDSTAPGRGFTAPATLGLALPGPLLAPGPGARMFWAVAAAVLAEAMRPAVAPGAPARSLALASPAAVSLGGAAAAVCGCSEVVFPRNDRYDAHLAEVEQRRRSHSWPVLVRRAGAIRKPYLMGEAAALVPPGCVLAADPWTAAAGRLRRAWVVLDQHVPEIAGPAAMAGGVVPAYLQFLCRRGLNRVFGTAPPDPEAVLVDLADWVAHVGGNPDVVMEAADWLGGGGPPDPRAALQSLLDRLAADGAAVPVSHDPDGRRVVAVGALAAALRDRGVPLALLPDAHADAFRMRDAGLGVVVSDRGEGPVWSWPPR